AVEQAARKHVSGYLTFGDPDITHALGALRNADLQRGQWWRLLSCCFVHLGLMHLIMNMLGLYWIGPLLERMWGSWRFLTIYLISGLAGSCAMSVSLVLSPITTGAGASGALWGMMTSMAAWVYLNRRFMPERVVSTWLSQLGGLLVLNIIISL